MKCADCDCCVACRVVNGIALCNACSRDIPSDADTIKALRAELADAHKLIDEHSVIFARAKQVLRIHDGKEAANAAVEALGPMTLPEPTPETMPRKVVDDDADLAAKLLRERAEQANLHAQELQALRAEVQRLNDADRLLREAHMATVRERDALAKEVEALRAMVPSSTPGPGEGGPW